MADDDLPERSPNARRNAIIVVVVVALLAIAAWALTRSGGGQQSGGAPGAGGAGAGARRGGAAGASRRPSATVGVAKVVAGDVGETVTAIGTVQPIVVATVRPQLSGNVFTINFTEGQVVRKGQLLAQIDPRPYRLALAQAQANLARDSATLNLNRADLQRYQTLLAQDSIARQQVQTQAALVKQTEGTVAADRALVGTAKLNLQYTSIVAPVAGRAGLRQVDIGNYLTPGDTTGVVVITQTTPIDVAFALPQADLQRLLAKMKGNPALPVTARDQAGAATLAEGRFLTFDNQIDATTGTVKAKARFPNPDGKLFPSQFVNVALLADTLKGVATVPVTAIRHGAQGDFVFVLQPDKTVKLTPVTVGPANGAQVAVTKGVTLGQTVITEGADNLDDGSRVSLPGDRRPQRPQQRGFFARLFGLGGSGADNAAAPAADNAQAGAGDNAAAGEHRRRRRQQGGDGGARRNERRPGQLEQGEATRLADARANPSRPFITRPVATTLLMIAILLAGIVSYRFLPLSALPQVDYPTIQVRTLYPGASPDVMGLTVTAPLERQFGQMAGLSRMSSVSSAGASVITLQFNLDLTLDVAEQEVQAAINAANTLLPADLPAPPIYAKVNPADAPVLSFGVTSETRPLAEVQNLVDQRVANKISQISGVGLVSLSGGQRPAVRIQANVQALAAHGLSLDSLRTAIAAANVNGAKGSFDGPTRSWTIDSNDQLATADDYKGLILAYRDGAPVRLIDVATVIDGSENTRLGAWMNRTPAIVVDVQRQPGANVIATVDTIKAQLPQLAAALPADVHVTLLTDRTTGIRASVHDVQVELVFAVVLVTIAIFLFLGSLQATIIASIAVPLSIVGTFSVMYLMGFSLNNLTLMALTIASGFVVDDAIVVTENIARHLEEGARPIDAALRGAQEIGFTIISLTVSLVAVLIPLLFMGDVVGRLFREFAVTLAVTILISAVVALTLVPMLSARWLKPEHEQRRPRFVERTIAAFDWLARHYARWLDWVLLRQGLTLLIFAGSLALTAFLFLIVPKGLFPVQDTGQLQATVVAGEGVSFGRMSELQGKVAQMILADPDVASLSGNVGVDGQNPSLNQGRMLINLKDEGDRSGTQAKLIRRLQADAAQIPGVTLYLQPVQDLTIDAEGGPTQYRFALQGSDQKQTELWAARLIDELKGVTQITNVISDVQNRGRSVTVKVNRDTAARLGISVATIDSALYNAFGQRIISTIFTQTTQYRVILESQPGMLTSPQALERLYVPTSGGTAVPLSAVATFVEGDAPLQVNRVAQFPAVTVGFDLARGQSLGHAVDAITAAEQRIGVPQAITTSFLGAANAFRASLSNEIWLILAAIVVVYIVLGVLYESFVHPVTILSTLPSAGVGALLALWITGNDLGVIGIIGIVLLIGIVKKNAIMMIDFAIDAERSEGKDADAAIRQAAHLRFRPIMMTTFAALFAALPLIFGAGMGSELRQPLGLSIAGGLIVSQALTLFTTPVIFLQFEKLRHRFGQREREPELPLEARG